MRRALIGVMVAAVAVLPVSAHAQARATRIVVAFPPGGPVDIVARLIADPMAKEIGSPIIVENKPGGNTIIAAEAVARSPADGSVLFLTTMLTMVLNPKLYDKLPYDPDSDFAPIAMVVSSPTVLVVHPSNPAKDAAELAATTKTAAQPLPVASAGVGGTTHIALEMFAQASGAKTLHVPYKGAAPALQDLISNQVGAFFGDLPGLIGHVRGGKLKALGVLAKAPHPQLPGVRTLGEQGFAGAEMEGWYALVAPAKTPADLIARLNKAVQVALSDPTVKPKLDDIGATILASAPGQVTATMKEDGGRLGAIIKEKNIKVE